MFLLRLIIGSSVLYPNEKKVAQEGGYSKTSDKGHSERQEDNPPNKGQAESTKITSERGQPHTKDKMACPESGG